MTSAREASRFDPRLDADLEQLEAYLEALAHEFAGESGHGHAASPGDVAPTATGLRAVAGYTLRSGGKRLRPLLCAAAWRAAADAPNEPLPGGILQIAASLELIHGYSLVHDDLPAMDDARVRRGRPAAHRVYGSRAAATAGFAMIPLAFRQLSRGALALGLSAAERGELASELARGAGAEGMVGGQVLDLAAEGSRLAFDALERIHRSKTGALLVAAVRIGARAARAEPAVVDGLTDYAEAFGLAFQIADDVLDVTGRPALTGKVGRDEELAKATYVAVLGIDAARMRGRAEAAAAVAALRRAGIRAPGLASLARFAIERDR